MDPIEKTLEFTRAIETSDWLKVENALSDDFRFYGPLPDPIDKKTYLALQVAIKQGMPDLSFQMNKVFKHHDLVNVSLSMTGTHTKILRLPLTGLQPLPATQTKIHLPATEIRFKFNNELISEIHLSDQMQKEILQALTQLGIET
jgi:hypothetical protein